MRLRDPRFQYHVLGFMLLFFHSFSKIIITLLEGGPPRVHETVMYKALLFCALVAAATAQPIPSASIPGSSVPIGSSFDVVASFTNAGTAVGYGPFIDVVLPVNGGDGVAEPDGLTFNSASIFGSTLSPETYTFASAPNNCIDHPYAVDINHAPLQVCGREGEQLLVFVLPFGSFSPANPVAALQVNIEMSQDANFGFLLPVRYRSGFMFGADELNNPCCDPSLVSHTDLDPDNWDVSNIDPTLVEFDKVFVGSHAYLCNGQSFNGSYTITGTVAPLQSLTSVTVSDTLDQNLVYMGTSCQPACTVVDEPAVGAPVDPGDNTITVTFASLTGDFSVDVTVSSHLNDFGGSPVISPLTGASVSTTNAGAQLMATWDPLDADDPIEAVNENTIVVVGRIGTLCVSKERFGPGMVPPPVGLPGDIVEYHVTVDIGDYVQFDSIVMDDILSDGQTFDSSFMPTLEVVAHRGDPALPALEMSAANFVVNTPLVTQTISFMISEELTSRSYPSGQPGQLDGACAPPPSSCAGSPSKFVIVYHAIVDQDYRGTVTGTVKANTMNT